MTDKHVESLRVPCLDEGSTPSSSTDSRNISVLNKTNGFTEK